MLMVVSAAPRVLAKLALMRATSQSKSTAYTALASASRPSAAATALSRCVTDSPPARSFRVTKLDSRRSDETPSKSDAISSASAPFPGATRAALSSPSTASSTNVTFPSHITAATTRKMSRTSAPDVPTPRSAAFNSRYEAASSTPAIFAQDELDR